MAKFNTKRQKVHMSNAVPEINGGLLLTVLIDELVELQKKHAANAVFELDVDSGECFATVHGVVSSEHMETDEEYDKRFEQHKAIEKHINQQAYSRKKLREEQDRREFARLKKKFGNK